MNAAARLPAADEEEDEEEEDEGDEDDDPLERDAPSLQRPHDFLHADNMYAGLASHSPEAAPVSSNVSA